MSNLTEALEAAEQRKEAVLGNEALVNMPSELQARAVFSGFDINHAEFNEVVERAGIFFASLAASTDHLSLHQVIATAWVDAFLTGLLYRSDTDKPTSE